MKDPTLATENFARHFVNRYGEGHPEFFTGTVRDAIKECKTHRKLLAFYLHHDSNPASTTFATQVLYNTNVVSSLLRNFITYPWDFTHAGVKGRFIEECIKMNYISKKELKKIKNKELPALVIMSSSGKIDSMLTSTMRAKTIQKKLKQIEDSTVRPEADTAEAVPRKAKAVTEAEVCQKKEEGCLKENDAFSQSGITFEKEESIEKDEAELLREQEAKRLTEPAIEDACFRKVEAIRQKEAVLEESCLREREAVNLAEIVQKIEQSLHASVANYSKEWDIKNKSKTSHLRQQVVDQCAQAERLAMRVAEAKRLAAAAHVRAGEAKRQAETAVLREKEAKSVSDAMKHADVAYLRKREAKRYEEIAQLREKEAIRYAADGKGYIIEKDIKSM